MNWHFRHSSIPDYENCAALQPLLSLVADGMASRAELRQAQAHLDTCADCRRSLDWMRATHDVLATRASAAVPADLHARCRRAWAAEDALAPLPRRASPSRSLVWRPALAAVLSLSIAGLLFSRSLAPTEPNLPSKTAMNVKPTPVLPIPQTTHSTELPTVVAKVPSVRHSFVQKHELTPYLSFLVAELPVPNHSSKSDVSVAPVKAPTIVLAPKFIAEKPAPTVKKHVAPGEQIARVPPPKPLTQTNLPGAAHDPEDTGKLPDTVPAVPPAQVATATVQDGGTPHTAEFVRPVEHNPDPMASVRLHLSILNETSARKLAMTGAVHVQEQFVQSAIVYTPR